MTITVSIMKSINLNELSKKIDNVNVEYKDIVNYEIARENICSYIFFLSRKVKDKTISNANLINKKIEELIFIRDNLQIEDFDNVSLVLNELIPEYKKEVAGV